MPGRKLSQPRDHLLAKLCTLRSKIFSKRSCAHRHRETGGGICSTSYRLIWALEYLFCYFRVPPTLMQKFYATKRAQKALQTLSGQWNFAEFSGQYQDSGTSFVADFVDNLRKLPDQLCVSGIKYAATPWNYWLMKIGGKADQRIPSSFNAHERG